MFSRFLTFQMLFWCIYIYMCVRMRMLDREIDLWDKYCILNWITMRNSVKTKLYLNKLSSIKFSFTQRGKKYKLYESYTTFIFFEFKIFRLQNALLIFLSSLDPTIVRWKKYLCTFSEYMRNICTRHICICKNMLLSTWSGSKHFQQNSSSRFPSYRARYK